MWRGRGTLFLYCVICLFAAVLTDEPADQWVVKLTDNFSQEHLILLAHTHGLQFRGPVASHLSNYYLLHHDPLHPNTKPVHTISTLLEVESIEFVQRQIYKHRPKRFNLNDPQFKNQWHINGVKANMNVVPAWEMGITGHGVTISIADDGLKWGHDDFKEPGSTFRYNANASYDWDDNDPDPSPHLKDDLHGTECGGVAFAGANNSVCGVGIAFGASFSAQRLISKSTTDVMEAQALGYQIQTNDIFSCSWGPNDDGNRLEGPGPLTAKTIQTGVEEGRHGLGTIYVWAGGNGRSRGDSTNYDGYASSRFVIAVAAVDPNGIETYYSESGSSLLVSATSSPPNIVTTATSGCSTSFGGTSAAAPMVAGVVALVLEANPLLGWRDVQNILLRTARKNHPDDKDWTTNGANLHVNHKYGYGLVDTTAAVHLARNWTNLPPPLNTSATRLHSYLPIPDNDTNGIESTIEIEESIIIEHVEIQLRITHLKRGDLKIILISPYGTMSNLFLPHEDAARDINFTFTTARHWGEESTGLWKLQLSDIYPKKRGLLNSWTLTAHGHKA